MSTPATTDLVHMDLLCCRDTDRFFISGQAEAKGKKMKTIEIAGRKYNVKGELTNGVFYLEGPRGGNVVFAKPAEDVFFFYPAKGGAAIHEKSGLISFATREQLAA